jgi:hypothetical protein
MQTFLPNRDLIDINCTLESQDLYLPLVFALPILKGDSHEIMEAFLWYHRIIRTLLPLPHPIFFFKFNFRRKQNHLKISLMEHKVSYT